jgi:hypothetical protein
MINELSPDEAARLEKEKEQRAASKRSSRNGRKKTN